MYGSELDADHPVSVQGPRSPHSPRVVRLPHVPGGVHPCAPPGGMRPPPGKASPQHARAGGRLGGDTATGRSLLEGRPGRGRLSGSGSSSAALEGTTYPAAGGPWKDEGLTWVVPCGNEGGLGPGGCGTGAGSPPASLGRRSLGAQQGRTPASVGGQAGGLVVRGTCSTGAHFVKLGTVWGAAPGAGPTGACLPNHENQAEDAVTTSTTGSLQGLVVQRDARPDWPVTAAPANGRVDSTQLCYFQEAELFQRHDVLCQQVGNLRTTHRGSHRKASRALETHAEVPLGAIPCDPLVQRPGPAQKPDLGDQRGQDLADTSCSLAG